MLFFLEKKETIYIIYFLQCLAYIYIGIGASKIVFDKKMIRIGKISYQYLRNNHKPFPQTFFPILKVMSAQKHGSNSTSFFIHTIHLFNF